MQRTLLVSAALALSACKKNEGRNPDDTAASLETPPVELVMPDLDDVDLDQAFLEALSIALSANTQVAWRGHAASVARQHVGCPDFYLGPPPQLVDDDQIGEDAGGTSWYDSCTTPGGLFFRGLMYWESSATASGDPESGAGQNSRGSRTLVGTAVVGDEVDTKYQFRGTASDAVNRVDAAGGYSRWTYSSTLEGTITGLDAFDPIASETPGGFRAGMYTSASGGDADFLELRGDVYLFEHRIQEVFDSLSVDLELPGPTGTPPDACTLEPKGWMGIRDENAFWIDVVFMPLDGVEATGPAYHDEAYSTCDGCGTVYVRGIEAPPIGEVCPDFEGLWSEGVLPIPQLADYVLDVRANL